LIPCILFSPIFKYFQPFLQVIADYSTPEQKELSRDLEAKIKPNIRLVSSSMSGEMNIKRWYCNKTYTKFNPRWIYKEYEALFFSINKIN
jgi:hypothetical protein